MVLGVLDKALPPVHFVPCAPPGFKVGNKGIGFGVWVVGFRVGFLEKEGYNDYSVQLHRIVP